MPHNIWQCGTISKRKTLSQNIFLPITHYKNEGICAKHKDFIRLCIFFIFLLFVIFKIAEFPDL